MESIQRLVNHRKHLFIPRLKKEGFIELARRIRRDDPQLANVYY